MTGQNNIDTTFDLTDSPPPRARYTYEIAAVRIEQKVEGYEEHTVELEGHCRFVAVHATVEQLGFLTGNDGKPAMRCVPVVFLERRTDAVFDAVSPPVKSSFTFVLLAAGQKLETDHALEALGSFVHPGAGVPIVLYRVIP